MKIPWKSRFSGYNESVHLTFRPEQRLGLIYRADVAALLEAVITAEDVEHNAYNTGSIAISAQELADVVIETFGGAVTLDHDADILPLVVDTSHERAARSSITQSLILRR